MKSGISRALSRIFTVLATGVFVAFSVSAQNINDPDPNSPTPVLLSIAGTTRALAVGADTPARAIKTAQPQAFRLGDRITLFVNNITLMQGEGANAFRIYVVDAENRKYRFPVVSIERLQLTPRGLPTYALTVDLTDEIRYWTPPNETGDVLIAVTWRGLISNRVRLGLGEMGGRIKDDAGAVPTPIGTVARPVTEGPQAPEYVGYRWSGDRMRFLEQATFGPTFALDQRIRRIGLSTWLAEQFQAPYPSAGTPYPIFPLKSNDQTSATSGCGMFNSGTPELAACLRDHYTMYPIQKWQFQEAFYGDAQLRHRVSWALSQIWVTSGVDVQQSRHMVEYHKILSDNAFGNYRNLMEQMTLNPAMGTYLDMAISTRFNPNENYARELMQLFTIGLFHLNQDGTYKTDGQGNLLPTYSQDGVNNLTKVLTGWNLCSLAPPTCPNLPSGAPNYIDPMYITNTNNHDQTAKTLLTWPADPAFPPNNTTINACTNCTNATNIRTYANNSMDQALDNIFNHPNVGPFVSKIMIQHMVTSDPTPAYVERVAAKFNNNGAGVRGDMKAVVRAILLDPEARGDAKTDPNFGKLREPFQFATNFLRGMNVRSADGLGLSDGVLFQRGSDAFNGMGQLPFRSPTVFNYFPPDYGIPGTTLLGPEFALMTTGTTIQRQNFVNRMVYNTPASINVALPDIPNGTSLDFSDLQALATADPTSNLLMDELNRRLMHETMSPQMRSTILTAVNSIAGTSSANFLLRAKQAVHLVVSSSQYQVQR